jgi:prepilin-type N-terminal cleavage/methylation domain-containing protein
MFLKIIMKKIKSEEGFSLVEVVVAMGVFAIALLSIVQVFYYSVSLNIRANQVTTSANLARKEMDTIRLMAIDELDDLSNLVDSLPNNTREVDVDGDGKRDYELRLEINRQSLGHGENYLKYVVSITVSPIGMQSGVYIGPPSSYNLRTVILRNPDDQND